MKLLFAPLTLAPIIFSLGVSMCRGEPPGDVEHLTTPDGWAYDYIHLPKADGWKIEILLPTNWAFENENPFLPVVASDLMEVSGSGEMSSGDKAAMFEDLDSNGIIYSLSDRNFVEIYVEPDELDVAIPAFIGSFYNPEYDATWLEDIKAELEASLLSFFDESTGQASLVLDEALLGGSGLRAYARPDVSASLGEIDMMRIDEWRSQMIALGGIKIGVAGMGDLELLDPYLDQLLQGLDPARPSVQITEPKLHNLGRSILIENPNIESAYILAAGPLKLAPREPDDRIASLGVAALGGGADSRLHRAIRKELRASYATNAQISVLTLRSPLLLVSSDVVPEAQGQALTAIRDVLDEFSGNGFLPSEYERLRKLTINHHRNETMSDENALALLLAHHQLVGNDPQLSINGLAELLEATDLSGANAIVKSVFPGADEMLTIIVSPSRAGLEADCVIRSLSELEGCDFAQGGG